MKKEKENKNMTKKTEVMSKKYSFSIGDVLLSSPTVLAPMEAVNSEAFLKTCAFFGCGLVTTQAIEDVEDNFYNLKVLRDIPSPVAFQIMTNKPDVALALAKQVAPFVDVIDFNFGCPLKKVLGEKKGGYLLQFPHLIRKIVEPVVRAVDIPVTLKIRLGFDEKRETFLEIGKLAEEIGVSAITLHARYVKDLYMGKARWEKFKKLKNAIGIPVIANGDIFKPGQVKMLLDQGFCDAVMLGRSAKNDPRIFSHVRDVLQDIPRTESKEFSLRELFSTFYDFYMLQEKKSLHQLQDHASWFLSGSSSAKRLRSELRSLKSFDEVKEFFETKVSEK